MNNKDHMDHTDKHANSHGKEAPGEAAKHGKTESHHATSGHKDTHTGHKETHSGHKSGGKSH